MNKIIKVIPKLPNGKAPGLDGCTVKFFKANGFLAPTLNEVLITLILKKGKEATDFI